MLNHFFAWTRRNTRKAVALLMGPGLLMLGLDAGIAHFAGKEPGDAVNWQRLPVFYSMAAALLLMIAVIPRSRAVFAVVARVAGVVGVVVGLAGTWFHIQALLADMKGSYDAATLVGSLSVTPPVFAPLAFTGIGALVYLLASPKLMIRYKLGRAEKKAAQVLPVAEGIFSRRVG